MDVVSRAGADGGRGVHREGHRTFRPPPSRRAVPQPLLPHAVEIHPDRSGGVRAPRSVYVHWTGARVHWTAAGRRVL